MLEQWRQIVSEWPDLVVLVDAQGNVVSCSRSFCEWIGRAPRDLIDRHVHDELCAPARSVAHTKEHCPLCVAETSGLQGHVETLLVSHNGSYLHAEVFRQEIELAAESFAILRFTDESKFKHTIQELHRMSYFVDRSPFPLAEFSDSGLLEFSNEEMTRLMAEIGYDDFGHLYMLPKNFLEVLDRVVSNKSSVDDIEVQTPDGRIWSWFFYHLTVGDEDRVHAIASNITERVRREAIEAQLEQTAASMREEARKQELAKLTHEFRSPLNSLVGFAGILRSQLDGRLSEQETGFLDMIEQGGKKLADQISDSLNAAREDLVEHSLAVSRFGTQDLCDELAAQVMPLAGKKFLKVRVECEDSVIETDRAKLSQILINFLDNAIKYTEQGSVSLIAKTIEHGYEFSVIDTGRGLTEEQQGEVFKDFYRTHNTESIQGTGLGLSVVRELAKRLQGDVAVESIIGQGARFYIRLPE